MIVIKTANGDRFINEAEVKNVQHNKSACIVTIKFKDGTFDVAYGVESMYYTNKADTEIRDNGLILGSTTTDKEDWKEMAQSAEQFIQDLQHWRNELENFILGYLGQPDEPYAVRFVKEMEEKRSERPDYQKDELERYRSQPWFMKLREESHLKGDEAEKQFAQLTKNLQTQTEWADRYKEAGERIMKRNLWQRIVNKKTYL